MEKNEKDQLNLKERRNSRSLRGSEREALQSRANSVKRAMYNVVEHSEPGRPKRYQRRLSVTPFEALKIPTTTSSDSTPCTSPLPIIPPINVISPTMESSRLTCISPLPDTRRESMDEHFFNTISLPVPRQFADSRRSSGVPEVIEEQEENTNGEITYRRTRLSLSGGANIDDAGNRLSPGSEGASTPGERNFLTVPILTNEHMVDPLSEFRPIEVFERNYYMSKQLHKDKEPEQPSDKVAGEALVHTCDLQVPSIVVSQKDACNVYTSDNITIIDTDGNTVCFPEISENISFDFSNVVFFLPLSFLHLLH